jgi:hypothetical protein
MERETISIKGPDSKTSAGLSDLEAAIWVGTENTEVMVGERAAACDTVLRQRLDVRIVAAALHDNHSVYYWASLSIHSRDMEASEEALLGVLRTKAEPVGGLT